MRISFGMAENPYEIAKSLKPVSSQGSRKWGCTSHFFLFTFLFALFHLMRFSDANANANGGEGDEVSVIASVVVLLVFYGTGHTLLTWFRPRR